MNKTIVFNPRKRLRIDEALNHPLFKDIRDKKKEVERTEGPVVLDFEMESNLNEDKLR